MASMPEDELYQFILDSASKKKARDELNEIDSDRTAAVQSFRKWVTEQADWLRSPTDFEFLLRFLRVRKFSQIGARMTLENYLTSKTNTPQWLQDVDPADTKIQEIFRTGFYFSPKAYDKEGRRLVVSHPGALDISKVKTYYGTDLVMKATCLFCNWMIQDEALQVNGIVFLGDVSGLTLEHVTTLRTPEISKNLMMFYQNSLPVRIKGVHWYNEPPVFDALWTILQPFMKEKLKKRMKFHGKNMANVYEDVEMSMFPVEYLPDEYMGKNTGKLNNIIEDMLADMMKPEFRNYIRDLSSFKYGVDISLKPQSEKEPTELYRKLNVE